MADRREARDRPMEMEYSYLSPIGYSPWLQMLEKSYGADLLWMLVASQHLIKGFTMAFLMVAVEWVFRDYGVPGPQLQVYKAIGLLPWAMKPVFGVVSDAFPVLGYNKGPYIVVVSVLGVVSYCLLAFAKDMALSVVVLLFLFCNLQVSVVDLLTEAKYANSIRNVPENGPDLASFVWGGIMVGSLIATIAVGPILEAFGARAVCACCIVPASVIFWPTVMNYMDEPFVESEEASAYREKLMEQKEVVFLCAMIGFVTLTLVVVGLSHLGVYMTMAIAVSLGFVIIISFTCLTSPAIGKMNCFFFIQTSLTISLEGATFYFFTDTAAQYPGGPHFSKWFYTSGIGIVAGVCGIIGMYTYNTYLKDWHYHKLMLIGNIMWSALHLCGVLVFTRYNLVLGIPDHAFVLGSSVLYSVVGTWMYMPGIVMLSQFCPKGMEATMYALLAGCHNLGTRMGEYIGAAVLTAFQINPSGKLNEGDEFANLWIAALLQCAAPVATIALIPYMIPDAHQTDKLLDDNARLGATADSPLRTLMARWYGPEWERTTQERAVITHP